MALKRTFSFRVPLSCQEQIFIPRNSPENFPLYLGNIPILDEESI